MKSLGENSQASDARKNVLNVPQAGLYDRHPQPVSALSITSLNESMRTVPHSRVTTPMAGDDRIQLGPTIARNTESTATSSPAHTSNSRGSLCKAGSWS